MYEKLLSLDPKNETLMYNLGVLEYETGNLSKSLPYFEKYLKLHPEEAAVHRYLFDIYKREKKEDLAFAEAKTLLTLDPKEVGLYHFAFEYLNRRGNFKEMTEIMKAGLRHTSGSGGNSTVSDLVLSQDRKRESGPSGDERSAESQTQGRAPPAADGKAL